MTTHDDRDAELLRPREPIDRVVAPLARFLQVEAASGVVLLAASAVALILANGPFAESFLALWKTPVSVGFGDFQMVHSLKHWINDGLMAVFFFVIGLEVKREIVLGEFRELRQAILPLVGAIGGMLVPALIYLALQGQGPARAGWGIPMATDIAFVVGCVAVLGSRVPHSLRILLLSIAIADDIGAILVIAVGYTDSIHGGALAWGIAGIAAIAGLARLGVRSFGIYTLLGMAVWFAFHESGVHATIAGVILGLMTPARNYLSQGRFVLALDRARQTLRGEWESASHRGEKVRGLQRAAREIISPLEYLESLLHPWVGFAIMPLFALANAGVAFQFSDLGDSVALAVAAGLVVGKPLGVVGMCALAVALGIARLPEDVGWRALIGGGFLTGIGFTMALFIGELTLDGPTLDVAKVGILGGSLLAALVGVAILRSAPRFSAADG